MGRLDGKVAVITGAASCGFSKLNPHEFIAADSVVSRNIRAWIGYESVAIRHPHIW